MSNQACNNKIVLIGNPNVGKSAIFTALTGEYREISNFPGTTVKISEGEWNASVVVDTPGVYGLSGMSQEEYVIRDLVLNASLVINVVNAVNLERDLFLTRQLIDAGVPVVVALNCIDEAEKLNLEIDTAVLQESLGVPVISTVAIEYKEVNELKEKLLDKNFNLSNCINEYINKEIKSLMENYGASRQEALFILDGNKDLASSYKINDEIKKDTFYQIRRNEVNEIVNNSVQDKKTSLVKDPLGARIGEWLLNPLIGFPVLIIVLWGLYEIMGVLIAQKIVGFTEGVVMGQYYEPAIRTLIGNYIDPASAIGTLLVGQFGVLTMTVTYVIGLLLPLVLGFFLVLSLLEDLGYLPRMAIMLDRATSYLGLNGQAIIPLVLGFGCVTMACITTRILESQRERRIAIFLLALAVPCSAQMAFITAILASMGPKYLIFYIIIIFSILLGVGTLLGRFLPGYTSPLMIDLPALRLPRVENVLKKTWDRTYDFLKEAAYIFIGGALLLSLFKITGLLEAIQVIMQPVTVGWLGLPKESANAFLMGFIRRDFGTAGMMSLSMPMLQQFVALVTLTLFVPCIATTMVIIKELGWKDAFVIWPSIFLIAFTAGGILNKLLEIFQGPWILFLMVIIVVFTLMLILAISRIWKQSESYL
ncbi:MAG: ferrous iron transport protein B [Clostridiales bacterium]|nr:ferrous iron transport protein B [Clostridiales bacterium]MCF8021377.1 ferrous iron transport protein B [Clostridiales bacterium]